MTKTFLFLLPALAILSFGAPATSGPAVAQAGGQGFRPAAADFNDGGMACRRLLPAARRHIGQPERVARAQFRAPPAILVRYCSACTRELRPNRLNFLINPHTKRVMGVMCG